MQKTLDILFISTVVILMISVCLLMLFCPKHYDDVEIDDIVMAEPFHHTQHTHEHSGLACCPCGVCHYKKENGEDEHYEMKNAPIVIRLIIVFTIMAVLCSFMHI